MSMPLTEAEVVTIDELAVAARTAMFRLALELQCLGRKEDAATVGDAWLGLVNVPALREAEEAAKSIHQD